MTPLQTAVNAAAAEELIRGKHYRFDPPIEATGFPTGGRKTCLPRPLQFNRGWYIGLVEGNHVFQGKPANDPRTIMAPQDHEDDPNLPEILERLRECYFHVLFIGGSTAVLDENQSH